MKKLVAGIKLIRPLNGMVAALSLIAAESVAFGVVSFPHGPAMAVFFLVSFGYAINDIFDLRADVINRPGRALPSGAVSPNEAWLIAVGMFVAGFAISIVFGRILPIYYLLITGCLVAYASKLSGTLIVSNVLVAILCASVFPLAAFLRPEDHPNWPAVIAASLLTFLFNLAREIIKDIEDTRGDATIGRSTLALKYGAKRARLVAGICLVVLVICSYFGNPGFLKSPWYLWLVTLAVNLPLLCIFIIYLRQDELRGAGWVSVALKILMLPALTSLAIGCVN